MIKITTILPFKILHWRTQKIVTKPIEYTPITYKIPVKNLGEVLKQND